MPGYINLDEVCDHAAAKLYNQPIDRHQLLNVATILQLAAHRLRRDVWLFTEGTTSSRQAALARVVLWMLDDRLQWLRVEAGQASESAVCRAVDAAFHHTVRLLRLLEGRSEEAA